MSISQRTSRVVWFHTLFQEAENEKQKAERVTKPNNFFEENDISQSILELFCKWFRDLPVQCTHKRLWELSHEGTKVKGVVSGLWVRIMAGQLDSGDSSSVICLVV